jgi:hypothetical protein
MKFTKSTLAATFAALLLGGLTINPASAAVRGAYRPAEKSTDSFYKWSDISSLTNGLASKDVSTPQFGDLENFYKWSDRNFTSQSRVPSTLKPIGHSAANFSKLSDITSTTHN